MLPLARAQQPSFDGGTVIDYPDPGYTEGGAWETPPGSYYTAGQSWTDVRRTGQAGAWAKWTLSNPKPGKYRVYFWHIPGSDKSSTIEITHGGRVEKISRSMQYGHIGWTSLGDYLFDWGNEASVKIARGEGTLIVDSVKFLPEADVHTPPPLPPYSKSDGSLPHVDDHGNFILNGQPYPVLYQELLEDTVDHAEAIPYDDEIFDIALAQGVNTLGTTLMWKNFETSPGGYNYDVIDALIEKARARNMHLDLILFFAWRNLQSYYVPQYVSKDHDTYLNFKRADGSNDPNYKVSPFADATRAVETKALQVLFKRVQEKDPDHQVVIMAQIENEIPSVRDYSAPAKQAWDGQVPKELIAYLKANEGTVNRLVLATWVKHGRKDAGTWTEVFGDDNNAARVFGTWCMGHYYIQPLINDLKKTLDIPLYMNAWQHESPSSYSYMDIFHAATPSLQLMGPDAYGDLDKWETDVGLSWRPWNRMTIGEQHHTANTFWRAIANYGAVISGQYYDVEGSDWLGCRETFDVYNAMFPLIADKKGTGDITGFFQSRHAVGESWSEYFQDLKLTYTATVRPHSFTQFNKEVPAPCEKVSNLVPGELDGCGLLISLGGGEYVINATRMNVALSYINGGPIDLDEAQVGHFDNGKFVSEGPATIKRDADRIAFSFPTENRHYAQVRLKLKSPAANPAMVVEAERGMLLKDADLAFNGAASGAFYVVGLKSEGAGIAIPTNASFDAAGLTIRYAADTDARADVLVDGTVAQQVSFPATGSPTNWSEIARPIKVPRRSTVSIEAIKGVQGPSVDCILLSRDAPPATQPSTH